MPARPAPETSEAPAPKPKRPYTPVHNDRVAVIIVHGMGEQRPMDTVRDFVETAWRRNPDVAPPGGGPADVWSQPDSRSGSLELRRIATRKVRGSEKSRDGVQTNFYELYWADLTAGSTWKQVVNWVRYLLFRPLRLVPPDVRLAWVLMWVLSIAAVVMAIASALPKEVWECAPSWLQWAVPWRWVLLALGGGLAATVHGMATSTFGRVIRYTRSEPDNIAARAAVRDRALKLIDALHAGGGYDRIIVVGHSLGTILAYDLVNYAWAGREAARTLSTTEELAAFKAVDAAAAALSATPGDETAVQAWRKAQAALRKLLAARPAPDEGQPDTRWLISDFVTLGSPLTHAEFLLAASPEDLKRRIAEREFTVSPPFRETLETWQAGKAVTAGLLPKGSKTGELFAFPPERTGSAWRLHHAAPFAAVRWTNIHDPARLVYRGDLISGPLAPNFGPGVRDISLKALRGQSNRFSHTRYWAADAPPVQLKALRDALNFLDRD